MESSNVTGERPSGVDMGQVERMASAVLGGALLTLGLSRRSVGGAAVALASGELLYRGLSGRRHLLRALGRRAPARAARPEPGAQVREMGVERSITIGKSPDELYRFWREPGNLTRIMGHFAQVTSSIPEGAHWRVEAPFGRSLEWDTRVVEDRPGELLRWESLDGAELPNQGSVRFRPAPGSWGTEVTLDIHFKPPGGALGEAVLKRLRIGPSMVVLRALRRFKSLVETGEIPTLEHNPSARAGAHTH